MKTDEITAESFRKAFSYDAESGVIYRIVDRLSRAIEPQPATSTDSYGYIRVCLNRRMFKAHRVAWLLHYGEWPKGEIDHINLDRTDNRISNLRDCSRVENARNHGMPSTNTSGVKGVSYNAQCRKWVAQVCVNRKVKNLGLFDSIEQAAEVVRSARAELHGQFANHG